MPPQLDPKKLAQSITRIPIPGRKFELARVGQTGAIPKVYVPNFIAGPENRPLTITINALLTDTEQTENPPDPPMMRFLNPTLLQSGTGLGKTHLLRGLTATYHKRFGDPHVKMITATDFRREMTDAIEENQMAAFRKSLRTLKFFALDDFHRLATTRFIQEEFLNTLIALQSNRCVVIVTTLYPLRSLTGFLPGLLDRLESGLEIAISTPGLEARYGIICQLVATMGFQLDSETCLHIATETTGNMAEISSTLFSLLHSQRLKNPQSRIVTAIATEQYLAEQKLRAQPKFSRILSAVAKYYSITQKTLKSSSRKQSTLLARGVAVYLARSLTSLSYDEIGRNLGGRDHTTIMNAYRKISKLLPEEIALQECIADLTRMLKIQ